MTTRKRRKPESSRGSGKNKTSRSTSKGKSVAKVKVSAKSFSDFGIAGFEGFEKPTKATAQKSLGSGEKPIDPLVAWWIGLQPDERDQIGLRLLLKMRDLGHQLGDLYNDFQTAIPFTSKPPTRLIPPEKPKG